MSQYNDCIYASIQWLASLCSHWLSDSSEDWWCCSLVSSAVSGGPFIILWTCNTWCRLLHDTTGSPEIVASCSEFWWVSSFWETCMKLVGYFIWTSIFLSLSLSSLRCLKKQPDNNISSCMLDLTSYNNWVLLISISIPRNKFRQPVVSARVVLVGNWMQLKSWKVKMYQNEILL